MVPRPTKAALFIIQLATALSLFFLDIYLGPGIADGIGYSIVIVLCLGRPNRVYSLGWAGFTTILVVAGGIISPDRSFLHVDLTNRVLEIFTIWVVWFVISEVWPKTLN